MKNLVRGTATLASIAVIATAALPAFASEAPTYVETVAPGVSLSVLATSGDIVDGYQIAGVPDGTGAFLADGKVQVLNNHELSYGTISKDLSRAGGDAFGSTVDNYSINPKTQKLTAAKEFLTSALFYNYETKTWAKTGAAPVGALAADSYGTPQHTNFLNRFCSSSLSPAGRLFYKSGKTSFGIKDAVYLTGEEGGDESRGFAVNAKGQLVQIPAFGLAAWETFNVIPTKSKTTAVYGNEDGSATDSQLWLYQGTKATKGTWFEKAGLTNGSTYVMKIGEFAKESEFRAAVGKGKSTDVVFNKVIATDNGVNQNKTAANVGTALARVEDGAFDPKNPAVYYFVTTESNKDKAATALDPSNPLVTKRDGGALWKLTLNNVKNPAAGGKITMLLDGTEAPFLNKPDNIEVDGFGNIIIQEDPGNNPQLTRMFAYRISDGKLVVLNKFKEALFSAAKADASFITEDEETSGVLNVTSYFKKNAKDKNSYYVFVAQVHATGDALLKARPDITDAAAKAELAKAIEAGQIYLMTISNWDAIYGG